MAVPKRPMCTPAPNQMHPNLRTGILAYQFETSDDGKMALTDFVAADRAAFKPIQADPSLKTFVKNIHKRDDIETDFKKHKKDFNFDNFGVRIR